MTGTLRVTPEKLIAAASQFQASASEVKTITQSMMDIVTELKPTWEGEAASMYYTKLSSEQNDVNKIIRMIQEHSSDLQEMGTEYQNKIVKTQQIASSLKIDQIV